MTESLLRQLYQLFVLNRTRTADHDSVGCVVLCDIILQSQKKNQTEKVRRGANESDESEKARECRYK